MLITRARRCVALLQSGDDGKTGGEDELTSGRSRSGSGGTGGSIGGGSSAGAGSASPVLASAPQLVRVGSASSSQSQQQQSSSAGPIKFTIELSVDKGTTAGVAASLLACLAERSVLWWLLACRQGPSVPAVPAQGRRSGRVHARRAGPAAPAPDRPLRPTYLIHLIHQPIQPFRRRPWSLLFSAPFFEIPISGLTPRLGSTLEPPPAKCPGRSFEPYRPSRP